MSFLQGHYILGQWVCPKCRGSCGEGCVTCCNCGPCRKSKSLEPTGILIPEARKAGFDNVHDYLIHKETGESQTQIEKRRRDVALSVRPKLDKEDSPDPPRRMLPAPPLPLPSSGQLVTTSTTVLAHPAAVVSDRREGSGGGIMMFTMEDIKQRLKQLRDWHHHGLINQDEYGSCKAKLLGNVAG